MELYLFDRFQFVYTNKKSSSHTKESHKVLYWDYIILYLLLSGTIIIKHCIYFHCYDIQLYLSVKPVGFLSSHSHQVFPHCDLLFNIVLFVTEGWQQTWRGSFTRWQWPVLGGGGVVTQKKQCIMHCSLLFIKVIQFGLVELIYIMPNYNSCLKVLYIKRLRPYNNTGY